MSKNINLTLKVWRQKDAKSKGAFEKYRLENISVDSSFLEMILEAKLLFLRFR